MTISGVFFVDESTGKLILGRDYRGDCAPIAQHLDTFFSHYNRMVASNEEGDEEEVIDEEEEIDEKIEPVFHVNGITFFYVRPVKPAHAILRSNLLVVAISRRNSNAIAALSFLHRLINVMTDFFGTLDEERICDNFVSAYELLDEIMDFGIVQSTDSRTLKTLLTQKAHKLSNEFASSSLTKGTSSVVSSVPWRPEGIKHRKNEVFLDVVEAIDLTVNVTGQVVNQEIKGAIKARSNLSGMPELKLGLHDRVQFEGAAATQSGNSCNLCKGTNGPCPHRRRGATPTAASSSIGGATIELEDIRFHQCVRLDRFDSERMITFIPPDGDFELMSYRIAIPQVKSQFKRRSAANEVRILIPVPAHIDTPVLKSSIGSASYAPVNSTIIWKIPYLPGARDGTLSIRAGLPIIKAVEGVRSPTSPAVSPANLSAVDEQLFTNMPIRVLFEIPYFTMSGLQVRYLKITERSGYPSLPWVRYITEQGDYLYRMPSAASK